jgi:hypothetical protein
MKRKPIIVHYYQHTGHVGPSSHHGILSIPQLEYQGDTMKRKTIIIQAQMRLCHIIRCLLYLKGKIPSAELRQPTTILPRLQTSNIAITP